MTGGYTGKVLRLNLTNRSATVIDTGQYEAYGGGHGLGSAIFWDLCKDKTISGFDPRNVVTLMAGPLTGTLAPSSARCEIQGIGPQAYPIEWFTRSSIGSRFATQLKYAGWDGIAIEGRADAPVWINIINDKVTFEDARGLWGMLVYETQEEIRRRVTGNARLFSQWLEMEATYTTQKPAILCIGPGGENQSRIGTLQHDAGSAAGQGGFGGVFGAKNLKAISVIGTGSVPIANPQALIDAWLWYKSNFQYNVDNPRVKAWVALSTGGGTALEVSEVGGNCYYSFYPGGHAQRHWDQPGRPKACPPCGYACRWRTQSGKGNDSQCADLGWAMVPKKEKGEAADLVQQYGLNTTGVRAMCVDYLKALYEMGIVGPGKQIECDLPLDAHGTAAFSEAWLKAIAYKKGIGADLSEGLAYFAAKLGRYEEDTDSGLLRLSTWGYGPHYEPAVEVEFSYESILAEREVNEHGFSNYTHFIPDSARRQGKEPFVSAERLVEIMATRTPPYTGDPFMWDYSEGPTGIYSEHRVKEIAWHRYYSRGWTLATGNCDQVWPNFLNTNSPDQAGATPEGEPRFFNAVTGKNISFVDGLEIGRKVWNLDRAIWILQGRHRNMEVFNGFVYKVPSKPDSVPVYENGKWTYADGSGRVLDRARFEEWKTMYYDFEGWDTSSGWPKRKTLEELGLKEVADTLESAGKLGSPD